jgi:hypothetical protein
MAASSASDTMTYTWGRTRRVVRSCCSAMELASDLEGLRLSLVTALGDRHEVRVAEDGSVIGLWQRDSPR